MITIKNLTKYYKKHCALDQVNLTLEHKVYGLLGPNGSGKTTLLRLLSQLIRADEGVIECANKPLKEMQIGYLPQKFGIFKDITVQDQLYYYCILKNIPPPQRKSDIQRVLENVHMEDNNKYGRELSGGMVRRLGIAQTFLGQPDFILLDEPSVGLDVEERLRFKRILNSQKFDCPVIVSTHIVEDVESTCEELIVLNKGKVIYKGTPEEVKARAKYKVYEVDETTFQSLTIPYYLVKISGETQKRYRILCDQAMSEIDLQDPTIEDGYMYLLKGPFYENIS